MSRLGLALTIASILPSAVLEQKVTTTGTGAGGSPHVKSEWTLKGAHLTVEYGRPFLRGRPEQLMMPAGRPWRTGADAATVLRTDKQLRFGSLSIEPGAYTLFTEPGATWQLILGKLDKDGQWGSPYQPALELHRIPMASRRGNTLVEQVTISIDETREAYTLRIEWGLTIVSVTFAIR